MPELPEVETIARALAGGGLGAPPLLGCHISGGKILWPRTVIEPSLSLFLKNIAGEEIIDIERRGKFLVFRLKRQTLLIHLRMSGQIRVGTANAGGEHILKHDRLILNFTNQLYMAFNDPRKFGRVWLVTDRQSVLARLGPEPLDPTFLPLDFHARLVNRRRQLKPLLMDQTFLAGLGNIYTDESLFRANINPCFHAHKLVEAQSICLLESIRSILQEGIERNGSSIDWVYREGEFQNNFQVYQRTGSPCYVCGSTIERRMIGQRSTHYCPVCQPNINIDQAGSK